MTNDEEQGHGKHDIRPLRFFSLENGRSGRGCDIRPVSHSSPSSDDAHDLIVVIHQQCEWHDDGQGEGGDVPVQNHVVIVEANCGW